MPAKEGTAKYGGNGEWAYEAHMTAALSNVLELVMIIAHQLYGCSATTMALFAIAIAGHIAVLISLQNLLLFDGFCCRQPATSIVAGVALLS